jgi:hypothetical protein
MEKPRKTEKGDCNFLHKIWKSREKQKKGTAISCIKYGKAEKKGTARTCIKYGKAEKNRKRGLQFLA